jgi:predicted aspartyl protease
MKFPYVHWRGRYCPLIEVELIHQDKTIRALAYADTGATYSVFHSEYCEELGIDLPSGKRVDITVGDGGIIPVYTYQLKIRIGDMEAVSKIGFSDRLGIGIPILGREYLR